MKYYTESRKMETSYIQQRGKKQVTSCIEQPLNMLLKKTQNKREDEEEDVNSCWTTLREEEILKYERRSVRPHSRENSR
jgi:hypothetical protein